MTTYQRIVLASRPTGEVQPDNFRLETVEIPAITDGQLLVRNQFLSLDPYMRGRMSTNKSYAAPQALGETMIGGTVGVVLESKHPKFAVGDTVVGTLGWTEGPGSAKALADIIAGVAPEVDYAFLNAPARKIGNTNIPRAA